MIDFVLMSGIGVLTILFLTLSGVIKGAIGFGQPLVAISLLTLIHSIEVSLALISLSLIATNFKLALTGGRIREMFHTFRPVVIAIVLGTIAGVGAISYVNKSAVQILLGAAVVVFVVLGFFKVELHNAYPKGPKGTAIGLVAGLIGGITSAYGPLLAIFLKSQKLEKEQFVTTLCFLILAGATTLSVSLGAFSIYTMESFFYAVLACIPTFFGLWLGEKIRFRIDTDMFFKVLSVAIFIVGLNLIRAGAVSLAT